MAKHEIRLSDHFDYKRLLTFVFPSIVMMIFTSIYGVVDGFFISNFVGKTPFAAVNLIMPLPMLLAAPGFMFGTGGSAIVAQRLGEKREQKANEIFSMLTASLIVLAVILTFTGELILKGAARAMGASDAMLPYCVTYGRILILGNIPFMLQYYFQSLFVTAGKPHLGLLFTVLAGLTNMIGDALTMGVFHMGVEGAAAATVASYLVGGFLPLLYFASKNSSPLRFCRFQMDTGSLIKAMTNGSSELMSNLSMSIVNMLYNVQLMSYVGENGVSAYGTIMYVNFIFVSFFVGYSVGSAPITSYHYGAGNKPELKNLLHRSLVLISIFAVAMTAAALLLAPFLSKLFVGYDAELYALTVRAFSIYSISFLILGFNIYASSFFTALGNGGISALISFLRTLVFQVVMVLLLPRLFGVDGIWFAVTAAELLALVVSITCLIRNRKRYGY